MVYVLVDAEVGPTKLDHQMLDWLHSVDLPYRIVATKCDQVKPSRQLAQRRDVATELGLLPGDIAWVSADKGTGIPELRMEVAGMLALL
jgi:GTP-binding protein